MAKSKRTSWIWRCYKRDKTFPKQKSLLENSKQELLSEKEFVSKIITAKEAKENPNFMLIARTEALISGMGMKEAIKRANAYEKAGADAILIHSKQNSPNKISKNFTRINIIKQLHYVIFTHSFRIIIKVFSIH